MAHSPLPPFRADPSSSASSFSVTMSAEKHQDLLSFVSELQKAGRATRTTTLDTPQIYEKCYYSCFLAAVHTTTTTTVTSPSSAAAAAQVGDGKGKLPEETRSRIEVRRQTEPDCRSYCYIRKKKRKGMDLDDDGSSLQKEIVKEKEEEQNYWQKHLPVTPAEKKDERFRFGALEGKYLYKAYGTFALAKYAAPPMTLEALADLETAQVVKDAAAAKTRSVFPRRRNTMLPLNNYETLYPLCSITSSSLSRFSAHLSRIFTPGLTAMQKVPTMLQDGTYPRLAKEVYERALSGEGLVLGKRLFEKGTERMGKWYEKVKEDVERNRERKEGDDQK